MESNVALKNLPEADSLELAQTLPSLTLSSRQICDIELILNGGFAPLTSFMSKQDYTNVLTHMRLADGSLWPMPIMLDVHREFADGVQLNDEIALRDAEGLLIAILQVEEMWEVEREHEAQAVFGTTDQAHPGVEYLYQQTNDIYLSGRLTPIALPCHYDFKNLRHTPQTLKALFKELNWEKIVAFQTRNPMHRAHQELTLRAAEKTGANLLLHPVVGMTKPGDIEYYTRVRCYEHVLKTYPDKVALLSLLPLAMRMGGPKEAIWHALIRKNYGCTHFIIGRDHAGPGKNRRGENFYAPYAAQELALKHEKELGISIVPFPEMAFSHKHQHYFPADEFPADDKPAAISGTELRDRLFNDKEIPEWFSYPAVISQLKKAYPPKHAQGFTIFMTGLPSSGKSTVANALALAIREHAHRQVTLLDGDIVRTHLSKGLGFSQEDRETNIIRVGFVAQEITRHGGIAICALVSPFMAARNKVREMIQTVGGFIEVYIATPLSICEKRDRKGLYKKAREGIVKQFTGISDPYEPPEFAEVVMNTSEMTPDTAVQKILHAIQQLGYLK